MNFPWDSDFGHALLRNLEGGDDLAADFAEYNTNWQLSLDGNLPGAERSHYRQLAETAARRIVLKII